MKGFYSWVLITVSVFSPIWLPAQTTDDKVYDVVDVMPQFPGGDSMLLVFIRDHTIYPKMASDSNWQGKVYVQAVIDKSGKITQAKVAHAKYAPLDAEALRVVSLMPTWTVGQNAGKPVSVNVVIPFRFMLKEKETTNSNTPIALEKETNVIYDLLRKGDVYEASFLATDLIFANPRNKQAYAVSASVNIKMGRYRDACNDMLYAQGLGDKNAAQIIKEYCNDSLVANYKKLVADTLAHKYNDGSIAYSDLDRYPYFEGGTRAILKFLAANTHYPSIAKENDIEGTVYVEFVVDTSGTIGKVTVPKPVDKYLDREAIRVVSKLPIWQHPGLRNGVAVNSIMRVPIRFKLQ